MDFGEALARLFVQAGRPTLRAAASRFRLSAQRISDWRNGRHLPRDFATVEPLLVWLTSRAVSDGAADVLTIPQWRDLWARHLMAQQNSEDGNGSEDTASAASPATIARPFAGLASLTADDSALYFGRDDLVTRLVDTVLEAASAPEGPRLVVVAGVSGSGKSSLLHAGLARDRRLPRPRHASVDADGLQLPDTEPNVSDPAETPAEHADVIVIDQFENAFALSGQELACVMNDIEKLATDSVVILGVRADFFGQCVEFPLLAQAWQSRCIIVSEMTDGQLREVISGPVRLAGGRIEPGLADVLIHDLHAASPIGDRAGSLPLLAHVLAATWARRVGNRMTVAGYRATGGLARAVADTAEAAWASVDADDRDLARALLMSLIHIGPAGIALRVPLSNAALVDRFPSRVSAVIDAFAQARLLVVSTDSVALVHDIVLTSWPRLAEWIAADAGIHVWRQQLDVDTQNWIDADRDRDMLYSGTRLEAARGHRESLTRTYHHMLSTDSEAFLDAAARQQRVRRLLRAAAIVAIGTLAVVSTIAAGIGLRQAHDLTAQRNTAEQAALLSHIESLQQTNPSVAARLLLAAHRLYPDDVTVTQRVLGAASSPMSRTLPGHNGPVYDVNVSADGRLMASASGDRTARLWSRADDGVFRPVATLDGYRNYLTSATFHPRMPLLATGSGDGTVRVWDISEPSRPRQISSVDTGRGTVYMTRFAADGRHLAASADDGSLITYAVTDSGGITESSVAPAHLAAARTLAYSPGGRLLATGGDDRVVHLWDVRTPDRPVRLATLNGFPNITHAVAFSSDGRTLAVTGDSPNAQLWDVHDPAHPSAISTALPNTTAGSWSIAFSPDDTHLASPRADGAVRIWNTVDRGDPATQWSLQAASTLGEPEQGSVRTFSAVYTPDGRNLIVGRSDGGIDQWTMPSGVLPDRGAIITDIAAEGTVLASVGTDARLNIWTADGDRPWRQHGSAHLERRVNDHPRVSLNETGTMAATANNNGGRIELWDVRNRDNPVPAGDLRLSTRYTNPVVFAPHADILATGADDRSIQIWDTTDPRAPIRVGPPLTGPTDLIRSVAFSPNGRRLAVSSDDKHTYLYDLDDKGRSTTDSRPTTVITDHSPGAQVMFGNDGNTLVVAARDLTVWDVRNRTATQIDKAPNIFASTLALMPNRLVVGTATHHLVTYRLDPDGRIDDRRAITPLIPTTDSTSTWQFPERMPTDDTIIAGGDATGSLQLQTTRLDVAQDWICRTTAELSSEDRSTYLPHTATGPECGS